MNTHFSSDMAFRTIALGPYVGQVDRQPNGSILIRSADQLRGSPSRYTEPLLRWARERPEACFIAKRDEQGAWQHLRYGETLEKIRSLGQALRDRGLSPERPLLILSENDIEHALLALAAMHVGVAYVPLSPAYSLLSKDGERVRHAVSLLTPGLVFASDAARYAGAIQAAVPADVELVFTRGGIPGRNCTSFDAMLQTGPTDQVDQEHEAVRPETIAKFLFTSGSTKLPKAVINTHGMMSCNQQMYAQCYPFLSDEPPVLVDWLSWHHTAGGNNNFGLVLFHGGTLYIDDGKPTIDGIAQTIRNLRDVAPTIYITVPKGLDAVVQEMKLDATLRDKFFSRLRLIFPAGAALSGPLKKAVDDLAVAACGARIPMTMGLGMTETAPFAISAHLPDWQAGVIGLPAPGVVVKLVPLDDKFEVRYRGPNVTQGYWRQPDLTKEAFDDEGYFCSGDAARFIDDAVPERGLRFDGRIAEDFKLISGTWVSVGALRAGVIAAGAPYIHDVVITGHDRDTLGMLVFPLPAAAEFTSASGQITDLGGMADNERIRAWAQDLLDRLATQATGSSNRIVRAMVLAEPASMELGEMTDKGSINQQAVLRNRATFVDRLYAIGHDPRVLIARAAN
ncbi:MAG: feruloyl-CoA synthase [Burkholderiales bacterium RIFCSPHIGHO2_12_FULL_61_11]|nr:MAG: feruloyl-CoA synthase [Burkholderiales bacterium RIFCSPHIGHO2_12_FULL_61_11]